MAVIQEKNKAYSPFEIPFLKSKHPSSPLAIPGLNSIKNVYVHLMLRLKDIKAPFISLQKTVILEKL